MLYIIYIAKHNYCWSVGMTGGINAMPIDVSENAITGISRVLTAATSALNALA